jgi:hypothetical protein
LLTVGGIYFHSIVCLLFPVLMTMPQRIGALLSISACGAFYIASVIWCCMPRPDPFCRQSSRKDDDQDRETLYEEEKAAAAAGTPMDRATTTIEFYILNSTSSSPKNT